MRKLSYALCLLVLLTWCGSTSAQEPTGAWITEIHIESLCPLTVTFWLENRGTISLEGSSGRAILTDQLGQMVEVLQVEPFAFPPGVEYRLQATSRWDFQKPGIYLVDVSLDLGSRGVISSSLAFRILPVRLPLAPVEGEGEGLVTIYQEPISWGLQRVHAPEAWTVSHGNNDIVVAVIDSGIDTDHPQLAGSLWSNPDEIPGNRLDDDHNGYVDDVHGWDFRDDDNSSTVGSKLHGHGTAVASIIAAQPGEVPIVGIAPGIRLMDVRFLDSRNSFGGNDWSTFVQAIEYAVDNGADIINLSIYANGRPPVAFEDALAEAVRRGVLVVGITGNRGEAEVMYPAKYDSVLAVSAISESDLLAEYSNCGGGVNLCAPGDRIPALSPGGRSTTQSGTSFAAPHVTGVLALILSVAPQLSGADAVDVLLRTAADLGTRGIDSSYGAGLVDAYAAVMEANR